MNTIWTLIGAILIFSVIIFVHELGHFMLARIFGVTVHEFAIGMGPALFQWGKAEKTVYSLRAIPMGGFCKMEGEDEESEDEGAFNNKKPIPRILILAAGAFMNLLLGFLVVLVLTAQSAYQGGGLPTTVVESVNEQASAAAFLQPGDRITAINGERVHIRRDLSFALSDSHGETMTLTFRRGKESITKDFVPMTMTYEDGSQGYVIGFQIAAAPVTVTGILHEAFYQTVWMVKLVFVSLGMLFHGQADVSDLSGPVGVVYAMNTVARSGLYDFLFFAAFLAVNIGVMNLLPLPALDGGRIIFVLYTWITGKNVSQKVEGTIHFAGILLLFALMIYVTFNDVVRIFG